MTSVAIIAAFVVAIGIVVLLTMLPFGSGARAQVTVMLVRLAF